MKARARGSWFLFAAAALLVAGQPACLATSSKIAHGQRYQSDDPRYDPYFDSVHQQQVAAAGWADEKKAARKPLVTALALTPGASDDTIVSATRARAKKLPGGGGKLDVATAHVTPVGQADGPLFGAVEESVRLELDRARKLRATADKLEEMSKHGEELKKSADHEYENRGAEKADTKKADKRNEIRSELAGSVTAMHDLSRDANRNAKDAQDFLEDIGDAIEAKDAPPPRRGERESKPLPPPPKVEEAKKEEPKKEEKPKKKATRPAAKPADKPAPADKSSDPAPAAPPPPAKKAPPPDEVFNP